MLLEDLTRLSYKEHLRWQLLAYRESIHTILRVVTECSDDGDN